VKIVPVLMSATFYSDSELDTDKLTTERSIVQNCA